MTRVYAPRGDSTHMSLLGYPIEVTNRDVTIFDKRSGVKLATVAGIPTARRFLKGYRNETVKAEPANDPAKVLAGSDKETLHA